MRPRSPRPSRPALAVVVLVLAGGCGVEGGDDPPGGPSVERIVSSEPAWEPGSEWRLVEDLRIGRAEGSGPEVWGGVGALAVDGEGHLYVLDNLALEIREFDAGGAYVRTIGRPGRGPGELDLSVALFFSPLGNLWVHDARNQRFTVFDTAGHYLREHPIRTTRFVQGQRFARDGTFLHFVAVPGERRNREVLIRSRLGPDGELRATDTLPAPRLPRSERVIVPLRDGGGIRAMAIPFTPQPLRVLDPRGYVWTTPTDGTYRLVQHDLSGDAVRVVERLYQPVEVSAEDRARARESLRAVEVDPDRLPDVHPPVEGLDVGLDGHLWVWRHVAPDRMAWDVFDPGGRYLGEVDPPWESGRFNLLALEPGALYGVWRDALDIQYVVRLRIERDG